MRIQKIYKHFLRSKRYLALDNPRKFILLIGV